jgi:hypothetical protein
LQGDDDKESQRCDQSVERTSHQSREHCGPRNYRISPKGEQTFPEPPILLSAYSSPPLSFLPEDMSPSDGQERETQTVKASGMLESAHGQLLSMIDSQTFDVFLSI